MRLTLRTLLAYLDDALEPAQAKLIGQKVAESQAAQDLIARIKQVTRRRRLTTPPATGPGARFDPNTIAEYLDNVLPAEQVAELEETCLASDVHLAEVAACHQVLTLFLGEPALVPPTARQRMYGLIRGREAIPYRKAPAPGPGAAEDAGTSNGEEEGTLLGLPFSRRDGNSLRWLVGGAAACLLVGAGIAIWMAVASGTRPVVQARAPIERTPIRPPAAEHSKPPEPEPPADLASPPTQPRAELLHAPQPDTGPTPAEATAETLAKPEPPPDSEPKPNPPSSPRPIAPASTARAELGRAILVPPAILLQRPVQGETWQRLKPQTRISSNDYLVSLPGYRSDLRMDRGVHLVLWGNLPEISRFPPVLESAVILHVNPEVDLDFTLDHGRVVLSNHKSEGPARVRMRFADEVWDLTLPDQNSEVAAELVGICLPYSKEPSGSEQELHLTLLALKGQPEVKIRYEQYLLPSPSLLIWDNLAGAARSPVPLPRPPDWWTGTVPPQIQASLEGLTNRLAIKNIDVALAEARNSRDSPSRVLALRCLGAMGNYPGLLDCLSDEKHADVRAVAIEELRHVLGLDAKNDARLRKALKQQNYPDGQAQTILQLVHGFSRGDWANPTFRSTAVEYLMHDKLAIRQLTHVLLTALEPEGRKIPYDPAGDSESRGRGYEAWRKLVLGAKTQPKTAP